MTATMMPERISSRRAIIDQKSEVRSQKSEVRCQMSDVRCQMSDVRCSRFTVHASLASPAVLPYQGNKGAGAVILLRRSSCGLDDSNQSLRLARAANGND